MLSSKKWNIQFFTNFVLALLAVLCYSTSDVGRCCPTSHTPQSTSSTPATIIHSTLAMNLSWKWKSFREWRKKRRARRRGKEKIENLFVRMGRERWVDGDVRCVEMREQPQTHSETWNLKVEKNEDFSSSLIHRLLSNGHFSSFFFSFTLKTFSIFLLCNESRWEKTLSAFCSAVLFSPPCQHDTLRHQKTTENCQSTNRTNERRTITAAAETTTMACRSDEIFFSLLVGLVA